MILIEYIKQKNSIRLSVESFPIEEYSSLFYWAIDKYFMPNDESERKALLNLVKVLKGYQNYLEEARNNQNVALLPFDFSDEYLGFVKVDFSRNKNAIIAYCCTKELKGYSIYPSCWRDFLSVENIMVEDISEEFEMPYEELSNGLMSSIKAIESLLSDN